MQRTAIWAAPVFALAVMACDDEITRDSDDDGGGGSGNFGGSSGGSGGAGGSGGSAHTCSGAWGEPEEVMVSGPNEVISSLSISENELTLHYLVSTGLDGEVQVTTRGSIGETFTVFALATGLEGHCVSPSTPLFDVTQDGLDAYITCSETLDCMTAPCATEHASRSSTGGVFAIEDTVTSTMGTGPAIAPDGLTLYTNALAPQGAFGPLLFATREATTDTFGTAQPIPGTASWGTSVISPEVSPDGLELYGHTVGSGTAQLVSTKRASTSDPFPEPTAMAVPFIATGSADLSQDCRALYFVAIAQGVSMNSIVYVMRR